MRALASHAAIAVSNARALRAASERTEWVAEAAHDIRGPIGTLIALLDKQGDGHEDHEEIRALAVHAMDVAESVLRDGSTQRTALDLSCVVERSCSSLSRTVTGHGARLVWTCEPNVTVMGVALDIRRCLDNLVHNAARFAPPDSKVSVRLQTRGAFAVLTVRDEGPGIPSALLPTLFERGVKGDSPQSQTGLGLAIVAARVRNLGGTIEASNAPGGGAVFRISLPQVHTHESGAVVVS